MANRDYGAALQPPASSSGRSRASDGSRDEIGPDGDSWTPRFHSVFCRVGPVGLPGMQQALPRRLPWGALPRTRHTPPGLRPGPAIG